MATSLKIDGELKDRLQRLAEQRHLPAQRMLNEAVAQYIEREGFREDFRQEALASWSEYRETGRHLTSQETRAWLRTWGTGEDASLPKCHD